jgi:hypothetical protein
MESTEINEKKLRIVEFYTRNIYNFASSSLSRQTNGREQKLLSLFTYFVNKVR